MQLAFVRVCQIKYDAVMDARSYTSVSGRNTVNIHIHNVLASIKQHVKHLVCERWRKQRLSLNRSKIARLRRRNRIHLAAVSLLSNQKSIYFFLSTV